MPTVAVGERVELGEAVMEPNRDFVSWIRFRVDPRDCVVEEHADRHRDFPMADSEIDLGGPVPSGPPPNIVEHVSVKALDAGLCEEIAAPARSPFLPARACVL